MFLITTIDDTTRAPGLNPGLYSCRVNLPTRLAPVRNAGAFESLVPNVKHDHVYNEVVTTKSTKNTKEDALHRANRFVTALGWLPKLANIPRRIPVAFR